MNTKEIVLQPDVEKAVMDLGFSEFTEIQSKVVPLIQQGKDVIGQSATGSGKTAAFGLPSLEKLTHGKGLQMLVLVPTRELCNQVAKEMVKFSKYKKMNVVEIYGGVSIGPQIDKVQYADIVIGTPGRMLDHMERGTINLTRVHILVLDEADKMFEMGFIDDVKRIVSQIPKERQTMLFSATISSEVHDIARNYMKNPEKIKVQSYVDKSKLIQHYYDVDSRDKFSLLVHLMKNEKVGLTLIFCATRHMVDALSRNLVKYEIKSQPLHGGLTQNRRKQVMDAFHANRLDVVVASDVAARGLDIKNVGLVVNYDLPRTSQEYVHRIGRTARAGSEGKVISLLAPQDHDNFRHILEDRSLIVEKHPLPQFERIVFVKNDSRGHGGFGGRPRFGNREGGRGGFGGRSSFGNREGHGYGRSEGRGYGSSEGNRGGFGGRGRFDRGNSHGRRDRGSDMFSDR